MKSRSRWLFSVALLAGCRDHRPAARTIETKGPAADIAALAEPRPCVPDNAAPAATGHSHGMRPHRHQDVEECPVVIVDDDFANDAAIARLVTKLLDTAADRLDAGSAGAAWTCADRATDLAPRSIDAHLLRGSALGALGRYEESAIAFAMALALAPNDLAVLRTTADAYLRARSEAVAGTAYAAVALELATRGYDVATNKRTRPSPDASVIAEFATLRAQALNYLGRGPEALAATDQALRYAPDQIDALYERGAALFDLHRFAEAQVALEQMLALKPDDAASHDLLGQTLEWLADPRADEHFAQARILAPDDYLPPQLIPEPEFRAEIETVLATLPAEKRAQLKAVRFEVTDLPLIEDLASVDPPFPPSILGLFRSDGSDGKNAAPAGPSIVLYRKNLARVAHTRIELSEQIRDTVLHEIGHFDGLDEDDLRRRRME